MVSVHDSLSAFLSELTCMNPPPSTPSLKGREMKGGCDDTQDRPGKIGDKKHSIKEET